MICTFVQSKCTFANANANFYATFKLIIAKFRKVLVGSSLIHKSSNTIYESQKVRISKYLTEHQIQLVPVLIGMFSLPKQAVQFFKTLSRTPLLISLVQCKIR